MVDMEGSRFVVDFVGETGFSFSMSHKNQDVIIPMEKWRKLLSENAGKSYQVQIYRKFDGRWEKLPVITNRISIDSVDPWLTYRLIPPEYDIWHDINIQQRHLESFDVFDVTSNSFSQRESCLNCHTPNQGNPDEFLVHFRAKFPGTIIYKDGEFKRLNTKTVELEHHGVYPSWHPSGRFIAFAVLKPALYFHADASERTNVFDDGEKANIGLLDLETNTMLASPKLMSLTPMQETYPCWSPDGKWLYYNRSRNVEWNEDLGFKNYLMLQFDLLRIPFDEKNIAFGNPELIVDAVKLGRSTSVPKISPNGRWLIFVMTNQGTNPTWRRDADLYLMDLQTLEWRPLTEVNSDRADTYVSWSRNSKWFVFTSKRNDGFVGLSHFSHLDENGQASKPFVLPQKNPRFYKSFLKSFNVPELATGKVKPTLVDIEEAVQGPIIDVEFGWTNDAKFAK
jgi:hypothetical protein